MPLLSFSQVLIFSLGRGSSARHFQKGFGLHANCPSMARSPPTDIMHLVCARKRPGAHSNSAGRRTGVAAPRGYGRACKGSDQMKEGCGGGGGGGSGLGNGEG